MREVFGGGVEVDVEAGAAVVAEVRDEGGAECALLEVEAWLALFIVLSVL